jgi:hypothetical protein
MHHWQDVVLSISLLAFNVALVPSVLGRHKPRLVTSVLTALFLVPELIVFVSLSLWYSFVMTLINTSLWTILAVQRYLQQHARRR